MKNQLKLHFSSLPPLFYSRFSPFILAVILAGVSGVRPFGPGRDYAGGYDVMFSWARTLSSLEKLPTFPYHDLGFGLYLFGLAQLNEWSDAWFYFLVAAPVLALKFWCFRRYSPNFLIALLSYLSIFFIVHEYTQLRVGSAIAVLMLAVGLLITEKRLFVGSALAASAVSLHLSTAVFLPFLFAVAVSIKLFIWLTGGAVLSSTLFELLPAIDPRVPGYIGDTRPYSFANPFSSFKLYQYATLGLFFYYRSAIRREGWLVVEASGWFLLAGVAFFFGTIAMPPLAHRISELFASFMPFLMAGLAILIPRKWAVFYISMGVLIGCWSSYRILI